MKMIQVELECGVCLGYGNLPGKTPEDSITCGLCRGDGTVKEEWEEADWKDCRRSRAEAKRRGDKLPPLRSSIPEPPTREDYLANQADAARDSR